MKKTIMLPLVLLCFQAHSQKLKPEYVSSGAMSMNTNCGIGEIFIIPDPENSINAAKTNLNAEKDSIKFYPNPIRDFLYVKTSLEIQSASIFTVDGKLISKENVFKDGRVDLSYLSSGTYLLISNELQFNPIIIIKE